MSMLGPMRDELFKYQKRKRKSIDGIVPGIPYTLLRGLKRYVSGKSYRAGSSAYHHESYMDDMPREYHPSLSAPSVQETEYETYEPLDIHQSRRTANRRSPDELLDQEHLQTPPEFILPQDDLSLTEQFLMAMGKRNEIEQVVLEEPKFNIDPLDVEEEIAVGIQSPLENEELTAEGVAQKFLDLTDAFHQLKDVLPEDHRDIVNLKTAIHDILSDPEAISKLESLAGDIGPSKLGEGNPYERDSFEEAGQVFEEHEQFETTETEFIETVHDGFSMEGQTLEGIVQQDNMYDELVPEITEQNMMLNEILQDVGMPGSEPEPAGHNAGMIADEINQAIDQLVEQSMPEELEPDPFRMQYDPFMAQQYMFAPQYMPDYMMPGPMPFGPMGPMPM